MRISNLPLFLSRHPASPLFLAVVAILLTTPSLRIGWNVDDYSQRFLLLGMQTRIPGESFSKFDMFSFLDGDPERNRLFMDAGLLPWWTFEGLRLRFFRPLSVLTHILDYSLWPNSAFLMHLQNLLWFGGVVALAAILYRRLLGLTWVAGLAALLYALDDAHGFPAGWIANRNTMIGTFWGFLSLYFHDRWRRDEWRPGMVLAPICFVAGLLSAEFAVGILAYFLSYFLFLEEKPLLERMRSYSPYLILFLLWQTFYRILGYGTFGSEYYVDPGSEPWQFLNGVLQRVPLLFVGQWAGPQPGITIILRENVIRALWLWGICFMAVWAVAMVPVIRRDRMARFWTVGMGLALLPICAVYPHERLLWFVGFGGMGLLAQFLEAVRERAPWLCKYRGKRILVKSLAVGFVALHLVLSPLALPLSSISLAMSKYLIDFPISRMDLGPKIESKDLVFVNAGSFFFSMNLQSIRALANEPLPRSVQLLSLGATPIEITRVDDHSLLLRPERGFFNTRFVRLLRSRSHPMQVGQTVTMTGMTAEVVSLTEGGDPAEVVFHFSESLDSDSFYWMQCTPEGEYVPFPLPREGETVTLPAVRMVM
ncbi:MAG TPA: hypothetical protein PLG59_00305 [bacterium]|nr:hypothetical protein [bacterium]HQO33071.1 hypothetical protein [bacterium]HQP98040.1 hypothetical protein [bacterium]